MKNVSVTRGVLQMNPARIAKAIRASRQAQENHETDIRLDLALGKPEDLSAYADCIQGARRKTNAGR